MNDEWSRGIKARNNPGGGIITLNIPRERSLLCQVLVWLSLQSVVITEQGRGLEKKKEY